MHRDTEIEGEHLEGGAQRCREGVHLEGGAQGCREGVHLQGVFKEMLSATR